MRADEGEQRRALRSVLWDGIASEAMGTLTTGVFLVGFALELDASNVMIGVLAAVPFIVQLLQIPSVALIEWARGRRRVCVAASGIGRVFLAAAATSPFFLPPYMALLLFIACYAAHLGLGAVSGCAWKSWMRDLVPERMFGRFFARRSMLTLSVAVVLSLAASAVLDLWKARTGMPTAYAYSLIFLFAAACGLTAIYWLARTAEPPMPPSEHRAPMLKVILEPFQDANFRRLMAFLASWNFAVNLAAPFFTVYMLRLLDYPMSLVIGLTVLSQAVNIAVLPAWGRLSDRFNNKSILAVSGPLFIVCILVWTFTTFPDQHALTLPMLIMLHALMGLSTAGVGLATGNIALKLSPRGKATAYLAASGVAGSLTASVAPILGGVFADFFASAELSWTLHWRSPKADVMVETLAFRHWDFFFFLAFVIGLYSIHRLALVNEVGEAKRAVILKHLFFETRRSIHSLSSVAGLSRIVRLPLDALGYAMRDKRHAREVANGRATAAE